MPCKNLKNLSAKSRYFQKRRLYLLKLGSNLNLNIVDSVAVHSNVNARISSEDFHNAQLRQRSYHEYSISRSCTYSTRGDTILAIVLEAELLERDAASFKTVQPLLCYFVDSSSSIGYNCQFLQL